jgi:hypothetical protein
MKDNLLKNILDNEFLETLAKSADLYKIGSNSVLDPEEIRIGLKVVPRAVMSMLLSELGSLEINAHKDVLLPFGISARMSVNKNAADDYTGSVYSNNKLVYDFKNRSIPGLGIILLSTFELYNLEELSKPTNDKSDLLGIQKLIDERMELHSLIGRVVEDKIAHREAIHKLMMDKLSEAMKRPHISLTDMTSSPTAVSPISVKPSDMIKKETSKKKELPLKKFLDRKKPKDHHIEMAKSETVDCESCGKTIFGASGFSACICYGSDMNKKIWIKKSDDGIDIRFSRGWDPDNIEQLLETLRRKNE